MSDLPKDVGLCAACNSRNSKLATKCHACGTILPWAQPKTPKTAPKNPFNTAPTPQFNDPAFKPAPAGGGGGVDIGGTVTAVGLGFLLFAVSTMCCFLGFYLYRHFNSEESWLQYPCLVGLVFNVILLILRRAT